MLFNSKIIESTKNIKYACTLNTTEIDKFLRRFFDKNILYIYLSTIFAKIFLLELIK